MLFRDALHLKEGAEKTARIAAWFQSLFRDTSTPVLVGGAAVELYTGGAYTTGDFDFVGSVPPEVAQLLQAEGFARAGRHWLHEEAQIFIELPSGALGEGAESVPATFSGQTVLIVAPEDLVIDRLAAWQFWGSEQDAVNGYLIWDIHSLDKERLSAQARRAGVETSLRSLESFRRDHQDQRATAEELERWAKKRTAP
ncbi:MAG: hypothetical protein AAF690_04855 [Acidobacteriota bacterium]